MLAPRSQRMRTSSRWKPSLVASARSVWIRSRTGRSWAAVAMAWRKRPVARVRSRRLEERLARWSSAISTAAIRDELLEQPASLSSSV